jgi:hypothetical protein
MTRLTDPRREQLTEWVMFTALTLTALIAALLNSLVGALERALLFRLYQSVPLADDPAEDAPSTGDESVTIDLHPVGVEGGATQWQSKV